MNVVPEACSWGSGAPQWFQDRALMAVQEAKPLEALEILQFIFAKNAKNTPSWSICSKLQFHEFCSLMS